MTLEPRDDAFRVNQFHPTYPRTIAQKSPQAPLQRQFARQCDPSPMPALRISFADQLRLRSVRRERRGQSLARVLKTAPVPLSVNNAGSREDIRSSARSAMTSSSRSTPAPVLAEMASSSASSAGEARTSFKLRLCSHQQSVGDFKVGACPPPPSFSHSIRSALLALRRARATPSCSIGSWALANARRVDENDGIASQIEKHLDQISGRSWDGRCNRYIAARQPRSSASTCRHWEARGPLSSKPSRRRWAELAVASARSIRPSRAPRFSRDRA